MSIIKGRINYKRFLIPYRVYGSGKICLLVVNGAQMTMGACMSLVSRYSKKYRVVIFDFPHQGGGTVLSAPHYASFDEQMECIEQVLKEVEFDSLYVFGGSWGATQAAAYAARHPGVIDKMILGSTAIKFNKNLVNIFLEGHTYYCNGKKDELAALMAEGFGERTTPSILKKQIQRQFSNMSPEHLEAFYAHCHFVFDAIFEDLVDFSKISCETLIVYGEEDDVYDLEDVLALQDRIKGCRLTILKGIGHFIHLENTAVMKVYDDFYQNPSPNFDKNIGYFDVSELETSRK
jgi:pimeloyl-ACP methyl ester carboxylesterase